METMPLTWGCWSLLWHVPSSWCTLAQGQEQQTLDRPCIEISELWAWITFLPLETIYLECYFTVTQKYVKMKMHHSGPLSQYHVQTLLKSATKKPSLTVAASRKGEKRKQEMCEYDNEKSQRRCFCQGKESKVDLCLFWWVIKKIATGPWELQNEELGWLPQVDFKECLLSFLVWFIFVPST